MIIRITKSVVLCIIFLLPVFVSIGCYDDERRTQAVPHISEWGIYRLDIAASEVSLVYSFPDGSLPSGLRLNTEGDSFVFAQKTSDLGDEYTEIYTIGIGGTGLKKLTDNNYRDLYPAWSSDGSQIAFLSIRENDLDIYLINADGSNPRKLYDSGYHDADIDWAGKNIAFTSQSAIWLLDTESLQAVQVTNCMDKGKWGGANLPIGDYDPRISPDGTKIVFERLENIDIVHGGYNFFVIDTDGSSETRLTSTGYSQGFAIWAHSGKKLCYVVAAIGEQGKYDIWMMNSDGTDNRNITPDYFPEGFLCHHPNFSIDDSAIYFLGQWWVEN